MRTQAEERRIVSTKKRANKDRERGLPGAPSSTWTTGGGKIGKG